jgi:hypothetical protein
MPDNEMMGDEQLPQDDHRNPRRRARETQTPEVGLLVMPEPRHELERLVLHDETRGDIATALRSQAMAEQIEEVWKLSTIRPMSGRCILNFYSPPGTGKTRAALGLGLEADQVPELDPGQTGVAQVANLAHTAAVVAGQVIGGPKALVRS